MTDLEVPVRPLAARELGELVAKLQEVAAVLEATQPDGSPAELLGYSLTLLLSVVRRAAEYGRVGELHSFGDALFRWACEQPSLSHPGRTVGDVLTAAAE